MEKITDIETHSEVTEQIAILRESMDAKGKDLESIGNDVQVIREVLTQLDFGGTGEVMHTVEQNMNSAREASEGKFDEDSTELDGEQRKTEEYEGTLNHTSEKTQSDETKIAAAESRVEFRVAVEQLERSRDTLLQEIDFLKEQLECANQARQESERLQAELERVRNQ